MSLKNDVILLWYSVPVTSFSKAFGRKAMLVMWTPPNTYLINQIPDNLLFGDGCDYVDPEKRFPSSLVFTPFEMALPFLLATANEAPGIDGGHVKGVGPTSHVPIASKSSSWVAHRHPERSGCHIAGKLTMREAVHGRSAENLVI